MLPLYWYTLINATHINKFWRKKIGDVDKEIPNVSGFVATTVLDTKISKVENKIPNVSGLVTTPVLNEKIGEVENKIHNVSGLVKKTDYNK